MDNFDLIDRKALKEALRQRQWHIDDIEEVMKIIDNSPVVEAFTENDKALAYCEGFVRGSHEAYVRPQGKWSDLSTDGRHIGWIACSVCGSEPPGESNYKSNFCPWCGAKMIGEDNEDK